MGKPVTSLAEGFHRIPQVWDEHGQKRMLTVPAVFLVVEMQDAFGLPALLAGRPFAQGFGQRPARRQHVDVSVNELAKSHRSIPGESVNTISNAISKEQ